MDRKRRGAYLGRDLPPGCWHNIFNFSEPRTVARAAAVNRSCKEAAYDDRLWYPHFKKGWSPESCGSLQTKRNGKVFHSLYALWQTGQPAGVELIPGVHGSCFVQAVQLSQAGALAAWSVGCDYALVGTDVTTCQIRTRFLPPHSGEVLCGGLSVHDSIGLVCTGNTNLTGFDPRQEGNGPAFSVKFEEATGEEYIWSIISAGLPDSDGPPQLLTGGSNDTVYLWDLRLTDGGPVRRYTTDAYSTCCLARAPRHGSLLCGGYHGITCCDWETGARLSIFSYSQTDVTSLAVGVDRVVGASYFNPGLVTEWGISDPQALVQMPEIQRSRCLSNRMIAGSMQGLGEGPDRILAGTKDGSICMWECGEDPQLLPICWSPGEHTCRGVAATCVAATDQLVVNGFENGAMRIMRVDTQLSNTGTDCT